MLEKILLFLFIAAISAESEDPILDFIKTIDGTCAVDNKVSYAEVQQMDTTRDHSRNLKCYSKCVLTANGILADGMFVKNAAQKIFDGVVDHSVASDMANKCAKNVGDLDACDVALEIFKCYDAELKKVFA